MVQKFYNLLYTKGVVSQLGVGTADGHKNLTVKDVHRGLSERANETSGGHYGGSQRRLKNK